MRILGVKLRGALGLIDQSEIEDLQIPLAIPSAETIQNFTGQKWFDELNAWLQTTPFQDGLIAFLGDNGSGKSTATNNLHMYPVLVSRDGKLQDHFILKDSYRITYYEHNGNIFESKILIDGVRKNIEGYIYKNGEPLKDHNGVIVSDGKISNYKKHILDICGDPNIFFTSMFATAKSSGVAGMTEGERINLFYDLFNLNHYADEELPRIKKEIKTLEEENISVTATLKALNEQIEIVDKAEIEELVEENEIMKSTIKQNEDKLTDLRRKEAELQTLLVKKEYMQEQEREIVLQIAAKKAEAEALISQEATELGSLDQLMKESITLFDHDNPFESKIQRCNEDIINLKRRSNEDKAGLQFQLQNVNNEISQAEDEKQKSVKKLERLQKIVDNKKVIEDKVVEKEGLTAEANKLLLEEKAMMDRKDALQVDYSILADKKSDITSQINALQNRLSVKQSEIEQTEKDIAIISKVPCSEEVGKGCKFLVNAFEKKGKLPNLLIEGDNLVREIDQHRNKLKPILNGIDINQQDTRTISSAIELKKLSIKDTAAKLAELNKTDWQKLKDELKEAEKNIDITNSYIGNFDKIISTKTELLKNYETQLTNIQKELNNKVKDIETQINNLVELKTAERQKIETTYLGKIEDKAKYFAEKKEAVKNEINNLKSKYNPFLDEEIQKIKDSLDELGKQVTLLANEVNTASQEVSIKQQSISLLEKRYTDYLTQIDKIRIEEAHQKLIERDLTEWYFLEKAYGRYGIPILKLENLAIKVMDAANQLLEVFDDVFRVKIETTSLKANGKDLKDKFSIGVIDDKGNICDIKMKSDGQQPRIETAIQLGIAAVAREYDAINQENMVIDEKDAFMTANNSVRFIDLLKKAHDKNRMRQTFVITHSEDAKALIPQQIIFKQGGAQLVNMGDEL